METLVDHKALVLYCHGFCDAKYVSIKSPVDLAGFSRVGGVEYVILRSQCHSYFDFGSYIHHQLFNIISDGKPVITEFNVCPYIDSYGAYEVLRKQKGSLSRIMYVKEDLIGHKYFIVELEYDYEEPYEPPVVVRKDVIKEGQFHLGIAQCIYRECFDLFNLKDDSEYKYIR